MTKTYTPPTIDEILNGASVQNETIDMDDDDLGDEFKMPDEVKATQTDQTNDLRQKRVDLFTAAMVGLSTAMNLATDDQKQKLLKAMFPISKELQLSEAETDKVKDTLKSFQWNPLTVDGFFDAANKQSAPVFNPMSMAGLIAMPPKLWLIHNIIGAGDLAMIYGSPGCGKTFVVIDMIFSACLGGQFARRFDVAGSLDATGPLNVAYCSGEGNGGLPVRFAAAAQHYGVTDVPNFTFFAITPQLYESEDVIHIDSIITFVNEWKARQDAGQAQPLHILFIDTLHSATVGADENSAKDMGVVLNSAKYATQKLGCAVVLVHHTNKGGTAERGSSAMRGAMDAMIEVRRISETGSKAVIHCAKLKDGEEWKDQTFDLSVMGDSVRVWWDEPSDASEGDKRKSETAREILELLAEKPDRSLPTKKISSVIAKSEAAVNRVLARLVKDKYVKRDEDKRSTAIYGVTDEGIKVLNQSGKV
jgi:DNA-binding transcriptional ArsR family regulator